MNFELIAAYLKTYSVRALLFLATLNTFFATMSAADLANIPGWFIGICNLAGIIATIYVRTLPQPFATAEIARAHANR